MEAGAGEGHPAPAVRYLDAEPNGLAAMLGGLIEGNLAAHPERRRLLRPATVHVVAPDAETSVSVRIQPSALVVANGRRGTPEVVISGSSETLLELSGVPLRFGFPDLATPEGRAALRKLRTGELRVRGLLLRPHVVSRFNRLLSVR